MKELKYLKEKLKAKIKQFPKLHTEIKDNITFLIYSLTKRPIQLYL